MGCGRSQESHASEGLPPAGSRVSLSPALKPASSVLSPPSPGLKGAPPVPTLHDRAHHARTMPSHPSLQPVPRPALSPAPNSGPHLQPGLCRPLTSLPTPDPSTCPVWALRFPNCWPGGGQGPHHTHAPSSPSSRVDAPFLSPDLPPPSLPAALPGLASGFPPPSQPQRVPELSCPLPPAHLGLSVAAALTPAPSVLAAHALHLTSPAHRGLWSPVPLGWRSLASPAGLCPPGP